jgi:hypothetical protein
MKLGIVSDTHGFFDRRLEDLLAGVGAILHAGDVGAQEVLDELGKIAPLRAVRGNTDPASLGLPPKVTSAYEGVQVEILHQLAAVQADVEKWAKQSQAGESGTRRRGLFLQSFAPRTRVVIFGHSHQPCLATLAGRLFFNPGSAGRQRFSLPRSCGLLEVSPEYVQATLFSLEQYNETLKVRLPFGG